jgi:hypothetical protein
MDSFEDLVTRLAEAEGHLIAAEALNLAVLDSVSSAQVMLLKASLEARADVLLTLTDVANLR